MLPTLIAKSIGRYGRSEPELKRPVDECSFTLFRVQSYSHIWTIGGIREFSANEGTKMETRFSFEVEEMTNWKLTMENCLEDEKSNFKITLSCEDCKYDKKQIKQLYLISNNGKRIKLQIRKNDESRDEFSLPIKWARSKANLHEKGEMKLRCDITIHLGQELSQILSLKVEPVQNKLGEHIASLWKDESFADLSLSVNGRMFRVHKCILSARSPGFKLQFNSEEFKEPPATTCLIIKDCLPQTIELLLEFIYTGKTRFVAGEKLSTDERREIFRLLEAAHLYRMADLFSLCKNLLIPFEIAKKAPQVSKVAEDCNETQLEEKAAQVVE